MARERTAGSRRGFWRGLLLTAATLGVYALYWNYIVHRELHDRYDLHRKGRPFGKALFWAGVLVPPVFWLYQRRLVRNVNAVRAHLGLDRTLTARQFLLWEVPGTLTLVGPFLAYRKLQGSINEIWDHLEDGEERRPNVYEGGARGTAL